ncbi:MAG: hypothetical protein FD155_871 [Bacteroidetes bacterium]|nr:MAG: hypothetical protein FD155_871 [Bacteroidota bacterium]
MAIDIVQYLKERHAENTDAKKTGLPFVTISRETGCHSKVIAQLLQKEIQRLSGQKWRIVSKETIFDAVKELKINPQQLNHVLDAQEKSHLEEIMMAFGDGRYKSYKAVRKTLMEIIKGFASEGHNIIIGRAGALITAGLRSGTHIRLTASIEWRIQSISTQQGIGFGDAALFVEHTDEKRRKLFRDFNGKDPDNALFDLIINNERIPDTDAVQLIIKLMEQRNYL